MSCTAHTLSAKSGELIYIFVIKHNKMKFMSSKELLFTYWKELYPDISDSELKIFISNLKEEDSLPGSNTDPEWYKDAKLGIFFDWGVYSVAGYGEKGLCIYRWI